MQIPQTRRDFLATLSAAGASAIPDTRGSLADEPPGLLPGPAAAEPPPETTTLRVHHSLSLCLAPQYVAEELLRAEGFTEVQYVTHEQSGGLYEGLTSGMADIGNDFAPMLIMHLDAGDPITILGGVHVGCFELFGTERVRSIRDLKGKSVAVGGLGFPHTSSSPAWWRMWVSIRARTSTGSCTLRPRPCSSSPNARSMP